MAMNIRVVWALAVAAVIGVLVLATHARAPDASRSGASAASNERPPAAVVIATVELMSITPMAWSPGEVISAEDARVASEAGGLVEHVAEVGTHVRKGQIVARLDDTAQVLRVRQTAATLQKARTKLEHSRKQEERYERLTRDEMISPALRDQIRMEREVQEHDLKIADAALDEARNAASHSFIRAPFDGMVVERLAQAGEHLSPGSPVVRLVNTRNLQVHARAPLALAVELPSDVRVSLRSGEKVVEQSLLAIVAVGDQASRQLELRVSAEGLDLPVGSAVEVGVRRGQQRKALMVPRDALVVRRDGNHVIRVVDGDIAQRVPVEIGIGEGDLVEVKGALVAGDHVVIRGGERIAPGEKVKPGPLVRAEAGGPEGGTSL